MSLNAKAFIFVFSAVSLAFFSLALTVSAQEIENFDELSTGTYTIDVDSFFTSKTTGSGASLSVVDSLSVSPPNSLNLIGGTGSSTLTKVIEGENSLYLSYSFYNGTNAGGCNYTTNSYKFTLSVYKENGGSPNLFYLCDNGKIMYLNYPSLFYPFGETPLLENTWYNVSFYVTIKDSGNYNVVATLNGESVSYDVSEGSPDIYGFVFGSGVSTSTYIDDLYTSNEIPSTAPAYIDRSLTAVYITSPEYGYTYPTTTAEDIELEAYALDETKKYRIKLEVYDHEPRQHLQVGVGGLIDTPEFSDVYECPENATSCGISNIDIPDLSEESFFATATLEVERPASWWRSAGWSEVARSDQHMFSVVTNTYQQETGMENPFARPNSPYGDCTTWEMSCQITNALTYLFYPSPVSLNMYTDFWNVFYPRTPIPYIDGAVDVVFTVMGDLRTAEEAPQTDIALAIDQEVIPFLNADLPLFTMSESELTGANGFVDSNTMDLIRTLMGLAVHISGVYALILLARNFVKGLYT